MQKDLELAETLDDVLRLVADTTIYECALPPIFQRAEDEGWIEWAYAGPSGRDWLALTDKGLERMGMAPNRVSCGTWLSTCAKTLKSAFNSRGKDSVAGPR